MNNSTIQIGYGLSVSENVKAERLAHQICEQDVNRKGGLLGRKVELICEDDEGDASKTAGIYKSLLDDDHLDLVIGDYGTNTLTASMPVIMERKKFLIGPMGLGVNEVLHYPHYYAMIPIGPNPNTPLTEGFFELAASQSPKPKTVALLFARAEFSKNPVIGAIFKT